MLSTLHSSLLLRVVSADDRSQWGTGAGGTAAKEPRNERTGAGAKGRSVIDEKGSFGIHPSSSLETRARACKTGADARITE